MNYFRTIIISVILLLPYAQLNGEELFFTYAGLSFSGGIDRIEYKDWFQDELKRDTKNVTGVYYSGGVILNIYVKNMIGELEVLYISNINDEIPVSHILYNAAGKYSFELNKKFSLTAGLGLYLETPPASKSYNSGGGFTGLAGVVYSLSWDWKLVFDINARSGHFGIGEDSTRISSGVKLAFMYKVGRI